MISRPKEKVLHSEGRNIVGNVTEFFNKKQNQIIYFY